jgi:hypothetical protein
VVKIVLEVDDAVQANELLVAAERGDGRAYIMVPTPHKTLGWAMPNMHRVSIALVVEKLDTVTLRDGS